MSSLFRLHSTGLDAPRRFSAGERFTRALVHLTRRIWQPECTLESAIEVICEVAASALRVERVCFWAFEREAGVLRRQHCWCAPGESCVPMSESPLLPYDERQAELDDVRTLDSSGFETTPAKARSHRALASGVASGTSRLDAPAFVDGTLHGLICVESATWNRRWSSQELTFAASMGDYVAMAHEIARRRFAEADLRHLRLHDASTGLPNREYLVELVRQRMAIPRKAGEVLAIVHVRIDVSRGGALSAGAPSEDEVMAQLAPRLRWHTNSGIDLARVHTNGFVFALARDEARGTAIRLAEAVLSTLRTMQWQHEAIDPRATAGIAFADDAAASDPLELLRKAEEAADQAQLGAPYSYEVFDLAHHEALVERLRVEHALSDALAKGQLELHYQPEYDATEGGWLGAEALLRWRVDGRLLGAAEFIDIAEASGLILPIGRWVLQRACIDAMQWLPLTDGTMPVLRVNVSARQFDDAGLVEEVAATLAASGLPPERLCLEITETTLMANIERATEVMKRLEASGVQLAIDDFGTGFAPLVYLRCFPIDVLKIDRAFVKDLPDSSVDASIIGAIAGLATALGIAVVAEGVETLEQERALLALGVRRMQGWRYARAMDQATARAVLSSAPPLFGN